MMILYVFNQDCYMVRELVGLSFASVFAVGRYVSMLLRRPC